MRLFFIALVVCIVPATANGDLIYAVDDTNLILVDPNNPGNSTIVGAHGLTGGAIPFSLAYDPVNDALVGTTTNNDSPFPRQLVQYDRSTGMGTVLAALGDISSGGLFEGVEYVDSLGSLVIGKAATGSAFAPFLHSIDLAGNNSLLATSNPGIDIDFMVYDSLRDRLLALDVAVNNPFYELDPNTGANSFFGFVPASAVDDAAYWAATDSILMLKGNELWRSDAASLGFSPLGVIPGNEVRGLAVVTGVPEPTMFGILGLLCLLLMRRRRRCDGSHENNFPDCRPFILPASRTLMMAVVATSFAFCQGVNGQTHNWVNTTSSSAQWHKAGNWSPVGPPRGGDTAQFLASQTYDVWFDASTGNPDVGFLNLFDGDVTFINQTSSLKALTINGSSGSGSFSDFSVAGSNTTLTNLGMHLHSLGGAEIVNGATLALDGSHAAGSRLTVGGSFDVSGDLDVLSGGIVSSGVSYIGQNAGTSGSAFIAGAGSEWNASTLFVGYHGNGLLQIPGGQVNSSFAFLGRFSGATGIAIVSGGGEWINSSFMSVGNSGQGGLSVQDGGLVTNTTGYIGRLSGSVGIANVTGGQWDNTSLYIGGSSTGAGGTGTLNLDSGQVNVSGTTKLWSSGTLNMNGGSLTTNILDNSAGGTLNFNDGTITVTGAGGVFDPGTSLYKIDGSGGADLPRLVIADDAVMDLGPNSKLWIGDQNQGELLIDSGADVFVTDASIGESSAGTGTVTVNGDGSRWIVNDRLEVGRHGTGILQIEDGSSVYSPDGRIGTGSLSTGNLVTVTDDGSLWIAPTLAVGDGAGATLNIEAGGAVNSTTGFIGRKFGIGLPGTVNVDGTDSYWNNSNNLFVGGSETQQEGLAILNINPGGRVTVGGTTKIWATGIVNVNGGRFEFGETTIPEFNSINANSGSLAGSLVHSGYTDVSSLSALHQNDNDADIREVKIANSGTLYGDANLETGLDNLASGDVETVAGERMRFAGAGNTNAGEINNFGGTIRFEQDLTNQSSGFISGRGQFVANGGWTNDGVIALSGGFADIHGDVINSATGQIAIGGDSVTTFYDDVTMDAANMNVEIAQDSIAVFFGSYNGGSTGLGDVHAFGDLRPGNSPDMISFGGDLLLGVSTTTFIELAGLNLGEFDQLEVAGDLSLDGQLMVSLIEGFTLDFNQEFLIADTTGSVFGQFSNFGEGDLVGNYGGRDLFITYGAGNGNDVALFTAVPEPGCAGLLLMGLLTLSIRRTRRRI